MNFLLLIKHNFKQIIKNKIVVLITFLGPLFVVLLLTAMYKGENTNKAILLVDSDQSRASEAFIKEASKEYTITTIDKQEGINEVKRKAATVCYEIPKGFEKTLKEGEKPCLTAHKIDINKGIKSSFEISTNMIINRMVLIEFLNKDNIPVTLNEIKGHEENIEIIGEEKMSTIDSQILHVIICYIFFNAMIIGIFIFGLKKENILRRSLTTANTLAGLMGAILAAMFIFVFISFVVAFSAQAYIRGSVMLHNMPIMLAAIAAGVFTSLSLGVYISSICQNEIMIIIVGQIMAWVSCFIGGSFAPLEYLPKTVGLIAPFTPQYWMLESILNRSLKELGVVLLFGIVFFLAAIIGRKRIIEA